MEMRNQKGNLVGKLASLRRVIEQEAEYPLPSRERVLAWERQYSRKAMELAALEVRAYRRKYHL